MVLASWFTLWTSVTLRQLPLCMALWRTGEKRRSDCAEAGESSVDNGPVLTVSYRLTCIFLFHTVCVKTSLDHGLKVARFHINPVHNRLAELLTRQRKVR